MSCALCGRRGEDFVTSEKEGFLMQERPSRNTGKLHMVFGEPTAQKRRTLSAKARGGVFAELGRLTDDAEVDALENIRQKGKRLQLSRWNYSNCLLQSKSERARL